MKISTHPALSPCPSSCPSVDPARGGEPPGVLAWQAADAIRALNHITMAVTGPGAGYRYPSEVDTVAGALQTLADRLPQTLTQMGRWLRTEHRQGRIGHDRLAAPGDDTGAGRTDDACEVFDRVVTVAVSTVLADLDDAAAAATALGRALQRARGATTHLTGTGR